MDEPQSSDAAQSGNQNGVSDRSRGIPILISTLRSITALRLVHHNIIILGVLLFVHKVLFPLTVCTLHHTLCTIPTLLLIPLLIPIIILLIALQITLHLILFVISIAAVQHIVMTGSKQQIKVRVSALDRAHSLRSSFLYIFQTVNRDRNVHPFAQRHSL